MAMTHNDNPRAVVRPVRTGFPHRPEAELAVTAVVGGMAIALAGALWTPVDASVVMVNPEHYAVALKWEPDSDRAPVCVAKGVDHLAARIREIALANDVPIYRDPPATRSIYRLVEVDEEILPEHFAAVAAAISFVDRLKSHM